jgi:CpXC motif protein
MTQLGRIHATCPLCKSGITAVGYHSINTSMDPEVIIELLHSPSQIECPSCKQQIPLNYKTLITASRSLVKFDIGASYEEKRKFLLELGVIDEHENVVGSFLNRLQRNGAINKDYDKTAKSKQKDLQGQIHSFYRRIFRAINEKTPIDEFDKSEWEKMSQFWDNFIEKYPHLQEKNLPPSLGSLSGPPDSQHIRITWGQIHYLNEVLAKKNDIDE